MFLNRTHMPSVYVAFSWTPSNRLKRGQVHLTARGPKGESHHGPTSCKTWVRYWWNSVVKLGLHYATSFHSIFLSKDYDNFFLLKTFYMFPWNKYNKDSFEGFFFCLHFTAPLMEGTIEMKSRTFPLFFCQNACSRALSLCQIWQ